MNWGEDYIHLDVLDVFGIIFGNIIDYGEILYSFNKNNQINMTLKKKKDNNS